MQLLLLGICSLLLFVVVLLVRVGGGRRQTVRLCLQLLLMGVGGGRCQTVRLQQLCLLLLDVQKPQLQGCGHSLLLQQQLLLQQLVLGAG